MNFFVMVVALTHDGRFLCAVKASIFPGCSSSKIAAIIPQFQPFNFCKTLYHCYIMVTVDVGINLHPNFRFSLDWFSSAKFETGITSVIEVLIPIPALINKEGNKLKYSTKI